MNVQKILVLGPLFGFFLVNQKCLSQVFVFPEEKKPLRDVWDRGCEIFQKLSQEIEKTPKSEKDAFFPSLFKRPHLKADIGPLFHITKESDQRFVATAYVQFEPEPQESKEDLWKSLDSIFKDPETFSKWIMPGINETDGWAQYFVTLDGLKVTQNDKVSGRYVASMPYTFSLLGFERTGVSSLFLRRDLESKNLPSPCLSKRLSNGNSQKFFLRMVPRPEIIELLVGELFYFQTQTGVEAWLHAQARPSPLIFQLMPELLMKSQIEKRGKRVFQNLVDFRRTSRGQLGSPSAKQ